MPPETRETTAPWSLRRSEHEVVLLDEQDVSNIPAGIEPEVSIRLAVFWKEESLERMGRVQSGKTLKTGIFRVI